MQRYLTLTAILGTVFALVLAPAAAGQAAPREQQPTVYTYVAQFRVAPGNRSDFTFHFNQYAKPILERLLADETLIEWGRSTSVVHTADGMTDTIWWCAAKGSGVLRVMEEIAKANMPPNKAEAHADAFLESLIFRTRPNDATGGYIYLSQFTAQTGKTSQWLEVFNRYYRPVLEGLLSDEAILGYGVDFEYVHTTDPRNRYMWVQTADAESADKVDDALNASRAAMSTAEREAMEAAMADVMVSENHRDYLDLVVEYHHR